MAPKLEVLVHDRYYDITQFAKRHPGGSIIHFFEHSDATLAWDEFHSRSKKAMKMLKALPSRPKEEEQEEEEKKKEGDQRNRFLELKIDEKDSSNNSNHKTIKIDLEKLTSDYIELRQEFEKAGYFDPSLIHVFFRYLEILIGFLLGFLLIHYNFTITGLIVLGIISGRCGWLMHEAGHYSLTGNVELDRFLQEMTYALGIGLSGAYWRNQHNKHHASPQRLDHDIDLNTLPLVAFHEFIAKRSPNSLWRKYQSWLFPLVITSIVSLTWQLYLHPRHMIRTKNYREILLLTLRWVLVFYSSRNFSFGQFLWMYLFCNMVGACYIFVHFTVSHTHKPVTSPDEELHWVIYSSEYTSVRNF